MNGSTQLAAAIGLLGLGSFTAVFLIAPLRDLYRSLGTRVQLEIIGLGHQRQMDLYRMYARATESSANFIVDAAVLPRIAVITERTLSLVEHLGEPLDPAAGAGGELPLAMDPRVGGPPGPGAKVFFDKSVPLDKPPLAEAPPTAGQPGAVETNPRDGHGGNVREGKMSMDPKMMVMDKVPMAEAPPPVADLPEPAGDDEHPGPD